MRLLILLLSLLAPTGAALAETVPLPKPRPSAQEVTSGAPAEKAAGKAKAAEQAKETKRAKTPEVAEGPSLCELRLTPLASFASLPVLDGPGACGARDILRLDAVTMPDGRSVPLAQPAMLRCAMAEVLAHWIREDVGPAAAAQGSLMASLVSYETYQCRGRNRIKGAKLSEHGKANAIDIIGVRLTDKRMLDWTDIATPKDFRERIRASACERFMTVLGPGSDAYHEKHIHLDMAERSSGYRLCQWQVRDAASVAAAEAAEAPAPAEAEAVPLPKPRPAP